MIPACLVIAAVSAGLLAAHVLHHLSGTVRSILDLLFDQPQHGEEPCTAYIDQ